MSKRPIVVTANDRGLYCERIVQQAMYVGLLEGAPTREMNQRHLDRLTARLEEAHGKRGFLLIEPEQRPIDMGRPYPFGTPAALHTSSLVAGCTAHRPCG